MRRLFGHLGISRIVPILLGSGLLLLSGCQRPESSSSSPSSPPSMAPAELKPALDSFTGEALLDHIRILSSDEYEGRAPGTRGEELTVRYLIDRFQAFGLQPGNPDGTWVQKVPLVGYTPTTEAAFTVGSRKMALAQEDYLARSSRFEPAIEVKDSDVVFVGYGVVAPEYGWDDFKGVDVRGKTVVMLINDPQIPDPQDPTKLDETLFKGRAMTYYGRWTYKFEIAAAKGAAAALIVHETETAGYPIKALASWRQENFGLRGSKEPRVAVEGWLTFDKARDLFTAAGQDLASLKAAALRRDFQPVPLAAKANLSVRSTLREIESQNVIARIEGSDPQLKNEYVVYTAHWDHMGRDPQLKGDQIFNGAIDNASGTACLLEWARAFATLSPAPKRTLLFLAVTAEERGLLGARYYAENPLYPLAKTVANLNKDGINQWGRTRDITVIGLGNSTLDDLLAEAARLQNRTLSPDAEPEKGFFYRSDHFEFAKQGVPALNTDAGTDYLDKPAGYAQQTRDEYTARDYHGLSDEIKPNWDLSGAVEDLQLFLMVGYRVAQNPAWPEWKPGTEFKAKRDAQR
ncbi:MAG: M28 family metallopeptidase [Blastocatellia bacterium]